MLTLDLEDVQSDGSKIRVTMTRDHKEKWQNFVDKDQVYFFSGGDKSI